MPVRVNREELLRCLHAVAPGLATREIVEQSACFVFTNGRIFTFNDEISCNIESPLQLEGATPAAPLLALLEKLSEPDLEVNVSKQELEVRGKGKRSGLRLEAQVLLPVDAIEQPEADAWGTLPGEFCEALDLVGQCASKDAGGNFNLTCVHIHPEFVEACDNFQLARYPLVSGIQTECLVRQASIKHIVGLGMTQVAETESWLHFRNSTGLILSCRRWHEAYEDYTAFLEVEGSKTTLPGGLAEAVEKAEIFSSDNAEGNHLSIELTEGRLRMRGEGASGWYEERRQIAYKGEGLSFLISPKLLVSLVSRARDVEVAPGRLKIDTGKVTYVACLIVPDELEISNEEVAAE